MNLHEDQITLAMICDNPNVIDNFFVVGVSYKNTDSNTRGKFSISQKQYEDLLADAPTDGLDELFVLSTCNRTEIYGLAGNPGQLAGLLCRHTTGGILLFSEIGYTKRGPEAILHLYKVAAGLDSQILGDYEIMGQLKKAIRISRNQQFFGSFLQRLVSSVLHFAKRVKTETQLSSGSVSVSASAVKYLRGYPAIRNGGNILVLGAGKIGRNLCKNILAQFYNPNITLINRTEAKAINLSRELGINHAPVSQLISYLNSSDVIFLATNATDPVVHKTHFKESKTRLIIDLSIPCNVGLGVREMDQMTVIEMDHISKALDENLKAREAEVPRVLEIIQEHLEEFTRWVEMRKHVPKLERMEMKLKEIKGHPANFWGSNTEGTGNTNAEILIRKVVSNVACKMHLSSRMGCHFIEAINEFLFQGEN